jgi:hypothetical protein
LDNTLTDFDKAVAELMGVKLDRAKDWGNDHKMWAKIDEAGEEFWSEMDWQPGGKELWEALKEYDPTILSSPTRHESSKTGKKIWVKENLGADVPVILESKKEKIASPDALLVDDRRKILDKWIEAGGVGVLHRDVGKTIEKVRDLMSTGKEAFKVDYVSDPADSSRRIGIERHRGGKATKVMPDKTKYDRARERERLRKRTIDGSARIVLAYFASEGTGMIDKRAYDDYKFRAHPVIIDPYDAIVQQAIQQMGPAGRNIDVVKLEITCPGNKVAWVTNEDFFHGKKDKKRVVHLCLSKIKNDFNKAHSKPFNMANPEDAKRMRELVVSYLTDVVLPHEETHIEQEVKGEGKFGPVPEMGAERAEDWSRMQQMGIQKRASHVVWRYLDATS